MFVGLWAGDTGWLCAGVTGIDCTMRDLEELPYIRFNARRRHAVSDLYKQRFMTSEEILRHCASSWSDINFVASNKFCVEPTQHILSLTLLRYLPFNTDAQKNWRKSQFQKWGCIRRKHFSTMWMYWTWHGTKQQNWQKIVTSGLAVLLNVLLNHMDGFIHACY